MQSTCNLLAFNSGRVVPGVTHASWLQLWLHRLYQEHSMRMRGPSLCRACWTSISPSPFQWKKRRLSRCGNSCWRRMRKESLMMTMTSSWKNCAVSWRVCYLNNGKQNKSKTHRFILNNSQLIEVWNLLLVQLPIKKQKLLNIFVPHDHVATYVISGKTYLTPVTSR